jgi:hypothetical protein
MDEHDPSASPYLQSHPPTAPPTTPDFNAPTAQGHTAWPTVLGIVGIVMASLGLVGALCAATMPLWMVLLEGLHDEPLTVHPATVLMMVFHTLLEVLLLIASIQLIKRRATAIGLWRKWAWAAIVVTIVGAVVSATLDPASAEGLPPFMPVVIVACSLVFSLALPVFALIWLHRPTIQNEIAAWE